MFRNLTYRKRALVMAATTAICFAALAPTTASAFSPAVRGIGPRVMAPLPRGGGSISPAVRALPPGAFAPVARGGSGGPGSGGEYWHPGAYRFGAYLGGRPVYRGYDDACIVRVHVSHLCD
jgi:hypothetical protein